MTFLAVFLFVALAVMALTMPGARIYRRFRELRVATSLFWGVGLAWLANLNMWTAWHIADLRYDWVGVSLTGVALAGSALVLHALTSSVTSLDRKIDDEAEEIEHTKLRRIA